MRTFCLSVPEKWMQMMICRHPMIVASTIDEEENELVQIDNNLCLNSDDSTDDDMNIQDNSIVQSYPAVRTIDRNEPKKSGSTRLDSNVGLTRLDSTQ
ncbi:unnamed protein product, partial [Rotaria magnacalcarata]